MRLPFLVVVLLLYSSACVISVASLRPEVLPTSEDLVFNQPLEHEFSGIGTPVAAGGSSSTLVSLSSLISDQLSEVLDPSLATVSSICSSMKEPGRFLLASLDGTVLSVDCKSGIQWSLQTGSPLLYSEQAISEIDNSGCFLSPGEDWNLYEYCAGSGLRKINQTIEEYVHNTPLIRGPEITIGSKLATVYLLDADSGVELHKERHPSSHQDSAHKFGKKLISPKLEIDKMARNYIIIVRTDYYLNSSVLGTPNWNMMESRISATYVNKEVPTKVGDDLNLISPYQKDIPVYLNKVNNAIMAGSVVPMLPSASDFHTEFASGDSSKDANGCLSGNCVLLKTFENKESYEDASLKPGSSHQEKGQFKNTSGATDDSLKLVDISGYDNKLDIQWNLKIMLIEGFHWGLQIFIFISFVGIVMHFWKMKEPSSIDKKLDTGGRISVIPKKKRTRKPASLKNSTVAANQGTVVTENQNAESNGNYITQSSDTNLMNLLRCNHAGDGRWVGKLFVSNTEIGRGSNGTVVFEGIYDGRIVAVKRLLRAHHDVAFKEIQNLIASDQHPNIVRWYGVEQDLDFVYISLERCVSSLSDLIQHSTHCPSSTNNGDFIISSSLKEQNTILPDIKGRNGDIQLWRSNGLPSPQLLKLMRDVVSGVAHLHELGIIHRDLKPQNVLVSDGKILTAKVSDMGISKRLFEEMSSLSHATGHGSSGWRAPEQLHHGRQSRAVDLFSLGCILFFCMTKGEHPFGKYYERDVNIMNDRVDLFLVDHIPEAVDLLTSLLNSEPKMRPNAVQVLHHPLFWSSETRLTFLRDISDRIELEDRENESELLKALENVGQVAFGGKWGDKLDAVFVTDMGRFRKYSFDCMRDLLRVIRNKQNHYRELPKELKDILGPIPEGFDQYFSSRFPRLLIEVYKVVSVHCSEEDSFQKYFGSSLL